MGLETVKTKVNYEYVAEKMLDVCAKLLRKKSCKKLLDFLQGESQVLNYLYKRKDETVYPKDISDFLLVSQARVTLLLNRMEKEYWVQRKHDEDDTRRILVSITDVGITEIEKRKREILESILDALKRVGLEKSVDLLTYTSLLVN